jgi:hypothetical protein
MYPSSDGYLLSLSSMLLMVRAARSMALTATVSGGAGGCVGGIVGSRGGRPGLLGPGVFMKAPGPGRCGVAGMR